MEGFNPTQKEELKELLDESLKAAQTNACGCLISEEMKREMPHVEQSFRAIGEGKLERGVERFRANNEMITQFRQNKKDTVKALARWAGIGLAFFTVWALWRGVAAKIASINTGGGM